MTPLRYLSRPGRPDVLQYRAAHSLAAVFVAKTLDFRTPCRAISARKLPDASLRIDAMRNPLRIRADEMRNRIAHGGGNRKKLPPRRGSFCGIFLIFRDTQESARNYWCGREDSSIVFPQLAATNLRNFCAFHPTHGGTTA